MNVRTRIKEYQELLAQNGVDTLSYTQFSLLEHFLSAQESTSSLEEVAQEKPFPEFENERVLNGTPIDTKTLLGCCKKSSRASITATKLIIAIQNYGRQVAGDYREYEATDELALRAYKEITSTKTTSGRVRHSGHHIGDASYKLLGKYLARRGLISK